MNWVLGSLFIVVFIWMLNNYYRKRRSNQLRATLLKTWGKQKDKEYFNFYTIKQYFENNTHQTASFHRISENTSLDLEIDDLFKFIDRTSSKIGQQYLYFKIRTIETVEKLRRFDQLSTQFLNDQGLRIKCQLLLSRLNTQNSYDLESLIHKKSVKKPGYLKYIYFSSLCSVVIVIIGFFNPGLFLLLLPFFLVNMVFHYKNKENVHAYISAVDQLSKALKVSKALISIKEIQLHFRDSSFIANVKSVQTKTEFIGFENHLINEYALPFWLLIELIKIQFMVEYIVFYNFVDSITKENESIDKLFQFIGEIDSAISVASLKSGILETCEPSFIQGKKISIKQILHPLIKNCVVNDIKLPNKSMLLTGSNMSGKTTFIKTVALNSILAQTLNVCFAKEYVAPFLKVYSSIKIADDLLEDTSYYLKEVLTVKDLVEASTDKAPCLFVLDEIFKGTNTVERISGGKAILSFLNKKNHIVLVSTHDIELTELLENENYDLYHFSESIENNELNFDHKLKPGKLRTRNAIKILELYEYPAEIITDAKTT